MEIKRRSITDIDKNLKIQTTIDRSDIQFWDVEDEPFRVYGIFKSEGRFRRMPEDVARIVSEGVYRLHTCTAGGRVRFITDSPYVAIKTECSPYRGSHFALTGSSGFDMYSEYDDEIRYEGTFVPPYSISSSYESVIDFEKRQEKIITINFPLYGEVSKLYIGLKEGSLLKKAPGYQIKKPVVYYGSSITQGGCASKPGSSYQSILSRRFNCNYINLGFSGSAKGEEAMGDYLKGLDMSIFVLDYDYNAPTPEALEETHSKLFENIRKNNPKLPILIMSRPKYYLKEEEKRRFEIIYKTYLNAKANGDENVWFISGKKLMELVGDNGTVDNCHPTDSGFFSMACAIGEVFEEILKKYTL